MGLMRGMRTYLRSERNGYSELNASNNPARAIAVAALLKARLCQDGFERPPLRTLFEEQAYRFAQVCPGLGHGVATT